MKKGDIVMYRGRKWFWGDTIKDKALLTLLPGEKKIVRGIQEIDMVKTSPKNLKPPRVILDRQEYENQLSEKHINMEKESPDPTPSSAEVYRKALEKIADAKVEFIPKEAQEWCGVMQKVAREALSHSSQPEQTLNWEKVGDDLTDILFNANGTGAGADDIVVYLRQLLSVAKVGQGEEVKGEDWISVEKALRFSEWSQWQGYNWNQTKNLWYYHPTDDWFTPNELFLKFKNTP